VRARPIPIGDRKPLVPASPDLFCGLACCIASIAVGFLLRGQRRIAFDRFSPGGRLRLLGLPLCLRGEFGGTRRLHDQFSLTHFLCGLAFGCAGDARLVHGYPFKALPFQSGVLASGAKFFQHRFFDSGGIIPTL
jgi:hypothetical protein